jgi:cytochrome c-type protein NapC
MNSTQGKGLWGFLRRPSARYSVLTLLVVGVVGGIVLWGGFNTGMEATNSLDFCISCHEMRNTVYQEYKKTIHYSNRTGVRAVCSDCHVPREWHYKVARKIQATQELWGKLTGTIDTVDKFEAKRLTLAEHEWERMKKSDSRECRNCHSFDGMNLAKQADRSAKQHEIGRQQNKTCIDCHKGIAHHKPKGMKGDAEDDV